MPDHAEQHGVEDAAADTRGTPSTSDGLMRLRAVPKGSDLCPTLLSILRNEAMLHERSSHSEAQTGLV